VPGVTRYSDDSVPRWNPGDRTYGEQQQDYGRGAAPGRYEAPRYDPSYADGTYGVPPQRSARGDTGGSRTGAPLFSVDEAARYQQQVPPSVPPPTEDPRITTGSIPVARRATSHAAPMVEPVPRSNVYRSRKPAAALIIAIAAGVIGVLMVRALAISAFGDPFRIAGVIASSLALAALPLVGLGLYGLVTGAAHGIEEHGLRVWGKPPLAYLPVGLVLLIAAAIAAPLAG
jgi:hypothetical protein